MGKGSSSPSVSSYTPPQPPVANPPQAKNQAQGRLNASSPNMISPWTVSQLTGAGITPSASMVPQFPGSGGNSNYTNNNIAGASVAPSNTPAGGAGVPGAAPVQWWNQTAGANTQSNPQTAQSITGMMQNVQPSLQGLGQLLGNKSTPNPS